MCWADMDVILKMYHLSTVRVFSCWSTLYHTAVLGTCTIIFNSTIYCKASVIYICTLALLVDQHTWISIAKNIESCKLNFSIIIHKLFVQRPGCLVYQQIIATMHLVNSTITISVNISKMNSYYSISRLYCHCWEHYHICGLFRSKYGSWNTGSTFSFFLQYLSRFSSHHSHILTPFGYTVYQETK